MDTQCPTCDRNDFDSNLGMRLHHAKTHGDSLTEVDLTCELCGDSYSLIQSRAENSRFCSNDCKMEWIYNNQDRDTTTVECDNCGDALERTDSEINDTNFCDRDCHAEWLSGENHHNWQGGKVEVECCVCGDTKFVYPNQAESEDRHFCHEKGCRYEWISEHHSGESHPFWKGGVQHGYPGGWGKIRDEIKERDGYTCRACGVTQSEHQDRHGFGLDVHHIRPVSDFESAEDAHSSDNLVTACRSCHMKFEGMPVFPN